MLNIRNISGTIGTIAENAIYGLQRESKDSTHATIWYSENTKDYRDENASIISVTYSMDDILYYLGKKKWEILP